MLGLDGPVNRHASKGYIEYAIDTPSLYSIKATHFLHRRRVKSDRFLRRVHGRSRPEHRPTERLQTCWSSPFSYTQLITYGPVLNVTRYRCNSPSLSNKARSCRLKACSAEILDIALESFVFQTCITFFYLQKQVHHYLIREPGLGNTFLDIACYKVLTSETHAL